MDFGRLLHTAQRNGQGSKKEVRYYSTKFEPPKKEQRNKTLSVNIKNFLAKKEAEEKQKAKATQKKREELLALRAQDKKATRRVNVMLKRTKSANQSVIDDAVDRDNTAVTLAGPSQPDEDDYGYVSQEAAAYYNKMMEKYSKLPDEPKFNFEKKKVSTNLNSTKEMVKAALDREKEEAMLPRRRKRKHDGALNESIGNVSPQEEKEVNVPKPKPRPPPPALNFADLLKIAEKKQHEPIIIEAKPKEEERPLTKKQKRELEREKEFRERKEAKQSIGSKPEPPKTSTSNRIPKLNGNTVPEKVLKSSNSELNSKVPRQNGSNKSNPVVKPSDTKNGALNEKYSKTPISQKVMDIRTTNSEKPKYSSRPEQFVKRPDILPSKMSQKVPIPEKSKLAAKTLPSGTKNLDQKRPEVPKQISKSVPQLPSNSKHPIQGEKLKKVPPKEFPPKDLKPKQFPPPDVRRKCFPPKDVRRKPALGTKHRILDDDDEEYDSEMDDFIDDGPQEGEDYSKYISEIFGYDKSKYRHLDDDVDNMESSFSQQMKEEFISSKLGLMEDLEDMKKEEEEKRRKALMKKRGRL